MDLAETLGKSRLKICILSYYAIHISLKFYNIHCFSHLYLRIMLERQHLTVKDYNKDQKAYASMLNKMYVAAKEGE